MGILEKAAKTAKAARQIPQGLAKNTDAIVSRLVSAGVPQEKALNQGIKLAAEIEKIEPPPATRELKGVLKPKVEPVRGQTRQELLIDQSAKLSDEDKENLALLKQRYPDFGRASTFMTPQEVSKVISNPEGVKEMNRLLQVLPQAKQLASVAKAGEAKRGWYRASTQALIDVFGNDAPRFASLLAATSPQTSVEMNLVNTLNIWKNWTAAGRPTDPQAIKSIMGSSVLGNKGEQSVLDAWVNNATRALRAEDPSKVVLSGPKVDSFFHNLADDVYRVTNDAWMANGLGVDQALFSGSPTALQIARGDPGLTPGYVGTSARLREAGQMANMFPAEAQETTWSLFKPLYEMQKETGLGAREILQRGLLTPEAIRGTPDFSTLLRDPKYGGILEQAGYGPQLERMRVHNWPEARMDLTIGEQRDLEDAAQRLERLQENRGRESRAKVFSMPEKRPETVFGYATPEYIPGAGIGHLSELVEAPYGSRQNFSSRASTAFKDVEGRDVLHGALGLNTLKTRGMQGAFRPSGEVPYVNARKPVESQPGFALGFETPVTSDLDIPQSIKDRVMAAESLRGLMTAQFGSPYNVQIPSPRGKSMFIPLEGKADRDRMALSAALQGDDSALADTGTGTAFLNFTGKSLPQKERMLITNRLGGTDYVPTKNISDYVDYTGEWLGPQGSGAATRKMLGNFDRLSAANQSALSEASKVPAEELYSLYETAAKSKNYQTRDDLMNLLRVLSTKGLPGVVAGLAAGEAFPAEESKMHGGFVALRSKTDPY